MATISKSGAKKRFRGGPRVIKLFSMMLLLGMTWYLLTLHLVFLPKLAEDVSNSALSPATTKNIVLESPAEASMSFPQTNEEYFYNPPPGTKRKIYMYHHTPGLPDKTEGSIILDMLLGHVYAYRQGGIYGGSCGDGNDVLRDPENSLIKAVGLENILQFARPRDLDVKDRKKVVPTRSYLEDGTRAFAPEYMDILRRFVKYPNREASQKTNTIVVHIRRGGKRHTPCRKSKNLYQGFDPYLPNKHYQLLIDKYSKDGYENKVIIYSQSSSYEPFDDFREKGYELHIDEDLSDVWTAALKSDVFIMSRSSFSFVPAMLTQNTTEVVYTPYWEKPLRGWNIVRNDIQSQSDEELLHLKSTCPKKGK